MKDLQILISKKGTKVVTASNLYYVLELPKSQYSRTSEKWLEDVYEFRDGIRRPENMRDFAKRNIKDSIVDDYYIAVELAKLIALNSRSKVKQKYAKWLLSLEDKVENAELVTIDQVFAILELTKVMGLMSCQKSTEKQHLETYKERNGNSAANWWKHRAQVLGYSIKSLSRRMEKSGKSPKGKSQRQMLMDLDKYEIVRAGIVDLFMSLGKSEKYARNLGRLAKKLAKEMKVGIVDDKSPFPGFAAGLNEDLIFKIKNLRKGVALNLW